MYKNTPLVSIVIPSYNHSGFIGKAIESVFNQTYDNIELIIIDDGSTDDSVNVISRTIEPHKDFRVKFFAQQNGGAHAAIMRGIDNAQGSILSILNSDDYYFPERISRMVVEVDVDGDAIAFSKVSFVDESGVIIKNNDWNKWYDNALHAVIDSPTVGYALFVCNVCVTSGNMIFTRSLYNKLNGFSVHKFTHDWDFLLRACYFTEPTFIQEELMAYRIHRSNTTESVRSLLYTESLNVLQRYFTLCSLGAPPNSQAPCKNHWPYFFNLFVRNRPAAFGNGNLVDYLPDHALK